MKNEIEQQDCMNCYKQYQINKTFDYDCKIYNELLNVNEKYKDKCVWIKVIEKDLENLANGGCLTFSEVGYEIE